MIVKFFNTKRPSLAYLNQVMTIILDCLLKYELIAIAMKVGYLLRKFIRDRSLRVSSVFALEPQACLAFLNHSSI